MVGLNCLYQIKEKDVRPLNMRKMSVLWTWLVKIE